MTVVGGAPPAGAGDRAITRPAKPPLRPGHKDEPVATDSPGQSSQESPCSPTAAPPQPLAVLALDGAHAPAGEAEQRSEADGGAFGRREVAMCVPKHYASFGDTVQLMAMSVPAPAMAYADESGKSADSLVTSMAGSDCCFVDTVGVMRTVPSHSSLELLNEVHTPLEHVLVNKMGGVSGWAGVGMGPCAAAIASPLLASCESFMASTNDAVAELYASASEGLYHDQKPTDDLMAYYLS